MAFSSAANGVTLLMPNILTNDVMTLKAVTACGGPTSIMKSGKGLSVAFSVGIATAIPLGSVLSWVNIGGADANAAKDF